VTFTKENKHRTSKH